MLKIIQMSEKYIEQLLKLTVYKEQKAFVGTIDAVLNSINDQVHLHLILYHDTVIGVFLIDLSYPQKYDFAPASSLGLRAYMIDSEHQGKGYGTQGIKILPNYLKKNYSDHGLIFLTVNCKNNFAHRCYLTGGFIDTNQLYLGGPAGPQHIMTLKFA
jgi:GNAT superfamily N-acetyltransferase